MSCLNLDCWAFELQFLEGIVPRRHLNVDSAALTLSLTPIEQLKHMSVHDLASTSFLKGLCSQALQWEYNYDCSFCLKRL